MLRGDHRKEIGVRRHRWAIAAALMAAGTAAILGALQSVAWHGAGAPGVAYALAGWLDPGLLLEAPSDSLQQPGESYFGYGRLVVGIYALLFAAGVGIRHPLPRRAQWLVAALLGLAVVGDILAYWVSEGAGPDLRRIGFWVMELPALMAMVVALSGIGAWRLRQGRAGGVLVVALPVSLATTALLGYLPHGILLGLALTGLVTLVRAPADAPDPSAPRQGASWLVRTAIVLGTAAGVLTLALMYRPVLLVGPEPARRSLSVSAGSKGARLHIFNTGNNRMSWLLVGRERPWRPVPAFVLEHPERGLIVFDTGFSDAVAELGAAGLHIPERWVIESRAGASLTLPAQMREAGLEPEAVQLVVISHLHGDHVGQLDAFPNAQMIGGPGSAAFAQEGALADRWREETFESTMRFGPFEDVVDLIGDQSIVLIRGGGHAPEGLMLMLALDEGPVLLAGDAVVHSDWLGSNDVQRIAVDAERAALVRNQVRAFADTVPDSAVAYGHDLRGIDCARSDIVCHRGEGFRPEGQ